MRYLIIKYLQKPATRRGLPGQLDEVVEISKKVKNRDWQSANVILDFRDQRVLQSHMDGTVIPKDWDRIVSYYYKHHAKLIEQMFEANGHPIEIKADPVPTT